MFCARRSSGEGASLLPSTKSFLIDYTQYKIDPPGSGDCITDSKVGNVEPNEGAAAYKDVIAAPKVEIKKWDRRERTL